MTLTEVLARRGVRYRIGSDHFKISINCPYCPERGKGTDTRFRLCIHTGKGWARCMHCDYKIRTHAIPKVLKQLRISASEFGFEEEPEQELPPVALPEDFHLLPQRPREALDINAFRYLLERRITRSQIQECEVGVCYSGRYAYRVVFPLRIYGVLKGLIARDWTGRQKPKYLFSRGTKYLYHFNPDCHTLILSEGVFKALRIHQIASRCSSASLLGHDLTGEQMKQIQESACQHIILYPDPDRVGRLGFLNVAEKLSQNWNGLLQIVWPVVTPADDDVVSNLCNNLHCAVPYGWAVSRKIAVNK